MSFFRMRLNKPLSDDWQVARAVFEEGLKAIGKTVQLKRTRTSTRTSTRSTQDEFVAHLLDVHRMCCDRCEALACPFPGGQGVRPDKDAGGSPISTAAQNPQNRKRYHVSKYTQTNVAYDMNGLQVDAPDAVHDNAVDDVNNDNINETCGLLSMVFHGEGEEPQADDNRSHEEPSNESVVGTKYIKIELLEEDVHANQWPGGVKQEDHDHENLGEKEKDEEQRENDAMEDLLEDGRDQLIKHEKDSDGHCSLMYESASHQRLEKEIPTQHIESDVQSHLERANQASDQPIKHERDSENVDIESSRNEAISHQGLEEENGSQHIGSCVQTPVERTNQASDQPIKHERDSQDVHEDIESSKNEATSDQRLEDIPSQHIESDGQSHSEMTDQVAYLLVTPEGNSEDHCDVDMESSRNESTSSQSSDEGIPTDGSDVRAILKSSSEPSSSTHSGDLHSHEGSSQHICHADQKTILVSTSESPSSAHICRTPDVCHACTNSNRKIQNTFRSDGKMRSPVESCKTRYSDESAFRIHTRTRSGPKPHTEPEAYSGQKPYQCSECQLKFSVQCDLLKHVKIHPEERSYQCVICSMSFIQKGQLGVHMRIHKDDKPYQCSSCDRRFSYQSGLSRHVLTHSEKKPFQCSICRKRFTYKGDVKKHIRIHKKEKPFKCDYCSYRSSQRGNLQVHMRTHIGEKPYRCLICDERFADRGALSTHAHSKKKAFNCSICGKRYKKKERLESHMRTHNGDEAYQCSFCSKSFSRRRRFNIHMMTHTGEKPYQCSVCSRRFLHKESFKRHMRTHTGEKPYQCSVCSKRFLGGDAFKIHKRIHTGEKPYKCSVCSKRFLHRGSYTRHMRIHTGEKPYQCSICDRRFSDGSTLSRHIPTHTGEKPYQCPICSKSFIQKGKHNFHMRTTHKVSL